jgi:NDP-sugar pyrophosphorylase family protein
MNSKLSLVILAGGLGSRYQAAKQIDAFGSQSAYLLEFAIYDAVQAGFSKILLIVNEMVLEHMKAKLAPWSKQIQLEFVVQKLSPTALLRINPNRSKPWGTAQAVLCAEPYILGPFVVMNADDYYGQNVMSQAVNFFEEESFAHGLIAYPLGFTLSQHGGVSRGICDVNEQGELLGIQECHDLSKKKNTYHSLESFHISDDSLVSMNFWLFQSSIFVVLAKYFEAFFQENHLDLNKECYLPSAIQVHLKSKNMKVKVQKASGKWTGLTFPKDREFVENTLRDLTTLKKYPTFFGHE